MRSLKFALAVLLFPCAARSQTQTRDVYRQVTDGSGDENYLRYLQSAGLAELYPWLIRSFSVRELARMSVKQGSQPRALAMDSVSGTAGSFWIRALPVTALLRANSSFPYGSNDGAVWAGRGLTASIDLGAAFRLGPLSGSIAPIAFIAQNASFPLSPLSAQTAHPYADPLFFSGIDRPQRFGSASYSRLDPGQTEIRLDALGLTVGASTANMGWGPMELYPYIIGANAAGFPHAFAGTSSPANIGIGKLHARAYWGMIEQSPYSPVQGTTYYSSLLESGTRRFMSGAVVSFQPRGLTGLEIGAARFFHSPWPKSGLPRSYLTKPFEGIFKSSLGQSAGFAPGAQGDAGDNQLASVFARWVFPQSAFEFYGEYGREDHSFGFRDFIQTIDHARAYSLGARKVVSVDSAHLSALRAELINYELPTNARHLGEGGIYVHSFLRQGHTNLGQMLGSDVGVGTGAGMTVAWDRYSSHGSTSIHWSREIRAQSGSYFRTGIENPHANDVMHTLGVDKTISTRAGELITGANLVKEFNRDFNDDAWNLNAIVGVRYHFAQ